MNSTIAWAFLTSCWPPPTPPVASFRGSQNCGAVCCIWAPGQPAAMGCLPSSPLGLMDQRLAGTSLPSIHLALLACWTGRHGVNGNEVHGLRIFQPRNWCLRKSCLLNLPCFIVIESTSKTSDGQYFCLWCSELWSTRISLSIAPPFDV